MNFKKTPARAIVMMAALFIFLFTQMADSFARYGGYRSSYRPSYSSYRSYSSFRSTSSFSSYRASRPYGMRPSSFSMSARNSFRVYPKSINSFSSISRTTKFTGGVTKTGYPIVTGKSGRKFSVAQSGMLSGKSAANMAYQRTERTRYNVNGTINKAQTRIEKIARGKSGVGNLNTESKVVADKLSKQITLGSGGLQHTLDRHISGGAESKGKSLFDNASELPRLAAAASRVDPIESGPNLVREVDAKRRIGIDRETGNPTTIYTVVTNKSGEVITMYPGRAQIRRSK